MQSVDAAYNYACLDVVWCVCLCWTYPWAV